MTKDTICELVKVIKALTEEVRLLREAQQKQGPANQFVVYGPAGTTIPVYPYTSPAIPLTYPPTTCGPTNTYG